jgi:hypothetical protein
MGQHLGAADEDLLQQLGAAVEVGDEVLDTSARVLDRGSCRPSRRRARRRRRPGRRGRRQLSSRSAAPSSVRTRRGPSRSIGSGLPVSIWQKSHRRVHCSPPMRKVASRSSQHSKMLGRPASWQTVWRPSSWTSFSSSSYAGPILARVLIHSGFFSMGVSASRTSRRNILRPSGPIVTTMHPAPRRSRPPGGGS